MILTTHAIVGAAVGRLVSNPLLSFVLGFTSHFLIDLIPHWGYPLTSLVRDKDDPLKKDIILDRRFIKDLVFIGADFCGGIVLSIFIFKGELKNPTPLLFGAIGGVFPDFLQFLYIKIRREPFLSLQKLHAYFHAKEDIPALPYGVLFQISTIVVAIAFSVFFSRFFYFTPHIISGS